MPAVPHQDLRPGGGFVLAVDDLAGMLARRPPWALRRDGNTWSRMRTARWRRQSVKDLPALRTTGFVRRGASWRSTGGAEMPRHPIRTSRVGPMNLVRDVRSRDALPENLLAWRGRRC